MFQTISWTGYITLIILILAVYYLYVLIKWFPKELKNLKFFKGNQSADENGEAGAKEAPLKNLSIEQLLIVDSKRLIRRAGKEKMPRATLLAALQAMIRADPWHLIREEPFRQTLNDIIRLEAETYCSIHLDDDELYGLWER